MAKVDNKALNMLLRPDIKKIVKGIDRRAKIALKGLGQANRGKDAEISYRLGGRK